MSERNPMQPLVKDKHGTVRFKSNKLVEFLLDNSRDGRKVDLNDLAVAAHVHKFSQDDQEQFAQLIGYSLQGFHELSYVSDETAEAATTAAKKKWPEVGGCRDSDVDCQIHVGVEREQS